MSNFAQRLYDHEAEPPPGAWDRIAAAIPQDIPEALQERLYNTTATPPAGVWDRIQKSLDEVEVKPASRPSVISMFTRYAAAAAILLAVAITALIVLNRDTKTDAPLAQTAPSAAANPTAPQQQGDVSSNARENIAAAGTVAATGTLREPDARNNAIQPVSQSRRTRQPARVTSDNEDRNSLYAYEDHVPTIAERYVMLMTPDGSFIRMSKKLGELVCCVTGQEQDEQCRSQLRKWQEKIASSPLGPGNVMDVLDLVNSMNNGSGL